jgi:hypothetical protein
MDIFESGFTKYDELQLDLLSFLKAPHGGLQLRRRLSYDNYTRVGREMIAERSQYYICRKLAEMAVAERTLRTRVHGRPVLRVRLLEDVVESWAISVDTMIGSDPRCGVCISGTGIEPEHVRVLSISPWVELRAEGGELRDRDGTPCKTLRLGEGDRISIGDTVLFFLHEAPRVQPDARHKVEKQLPQSLLKASSFALEVRPNQAEHLYDFWQQLAGSIGLSEQKQFLLANSLVEFIDLLAYANEPIIITAFQESGRVRFQVDCAASEVGFQRFVTALHQQLASNSDGEELTDPRFMAIALVRKIFDRIEVDRSAFMVTLIKNYT